MNSGLFIEMLKVLMHRRRKPLMLILDSLPAHKGKAVKNYIESTNGKLELHFLPGYAPELNPDELVWNYMKRTGTARSPLAKGDFSTSPYRRTVVPNQMESRPRPLVLQSQGCLLY